MGRPRHSPCGENIRGPAIAPTAPIQSGVRVGATGTNHMAHNDRHISESQPWASPGHRI